jgi:hypothetical protein
MSETTYRDRQAVRIENDVVRLTVLREGGHIAELLHKPTGVNPLWTPPWPSIEPSLYRRELHPGYGSDAESKLLAGIMGHNLCLDIFGGPSDDEAAAGMTVHGEASIAPYSIWSDGSVIVASVHLRSGQLDFERRLSLSGGTVEITETVHNCGSLDRAIAWTQHVTLGPPFVVPGETQFNIPATRSKTYEGDFGDLFPSGAEFDWPHAPRRNGGTIDLRTYTDAAVSAGYTAHLLDPAREDAYFRAWSPTSKVQLTYHWKRADFPWIGIWEENHFRKGPPWNGETVTRGLEFGASPMPETRRQMIDRGSMFGVPAYKWVPARRSLQVHYSAEVRTTEDIRG